MNISRDNDYLGLQYLFYFAQIYAQTDFIFYLGMILLNRGRDILLKTITKTFANTEIPFIPSTIRFYLVILVLVDEVYYCDHS